MLNTTRTVSDTKRDFYNQHTRPINSIYRRVVEELMVEMHLLSVNIDFNYDPIYALGVVNSFDRFMEGYLPENDKVSIFKALCHAVGGDAQTYRQDAEKCLDFARSCSSDHLREILANPSSQQDDNFLINILSAIATNQKFKYSRLFAIGLYTILETTQADLFEDTDKRNEIFQQVSQGLGLPEGKMQKDLELYRSNLQKMAQLLTVIKDAVEADRKQREKRAKQDHEEES